jgi:CheY-like chemotaxis protein
MKVLIPDNLSTLIRRSNPCLRRFCFDLEKAKTPREILNKVKSQIPALVVMDHSRNHDANLGIIDTIRHKLGFRDMKIVSAVPVFRREVIPACLKAGADDYIFYPIEVRDLSDKLSSLLRIPVRRKDRAPAMFETLTRDAETIFPIFVKDISEYGIAFSAKAALHVNDTLIHSLRLFRDEPNIYLYSRIVWAARDGRKDTYHYGCCFLHVNPIDAEMIERYVYSRTREYSPVLHQKRASMTV